MEIKMTGTITMQILGNDLSEEEAQRIKSLIQELILSESLRVAIFNCTYSSSI
jgi:hypothetical protein